MHANNFKNKPTKSGHISYKQATYQFIFGIIYKTTFILIVFSSIWHYDCKKSKSMTFNTKTGAAKSSRKITDWPYKCLYMFLTPVWICSYTEFTHKVISWFWEGILSKFFCTPKVTVLKSKCHCEYTAMICLNLNVVQKSKLTISWLVFTYFYRLIRHH